MGDARKPTALDDQDKKLDPQNFAYISDDTYTAEEVEAQTQVGPFGRSLSSFARAAGRRAARVSCTVLDGRCGFPQQLCDTVWFNSLGRRCTPPALAPACGTICSPSVPPPPPPEPTPGEGVDVHFVGGGNLLERGAVPEGAQEHLGIGG